MTPSAVEEPIPKGSSASMESSRRVLAVLMNFSEEEHTKTVRQIASELGVPVSSAYRYVAQLRDVGLLEESEFGGYRVSLRSLDLARSARAGAAGIGDLTGPALERLTQVTGETSLLVHRLGHAVIATDMVESPRPVRLAFERGRLMPLNKGSAACVLLAAMSPTTRSEYYATLYSIESDPQLPTDSQLEEVTASGYAESLGQVEEGIWGFAAAIKVGRQVVAAISVAGPIYRLDEPAREAIRAAVVGEASRINKAIMQIEF